MISLRPKVGGAEVQLRSRHILYKSPVVRKIHHYHHYHHHHHHHIAMSALLIIATQKPPGGGRLRGGVLLGGPCLALGPKDGGPSVNLHELEAASQARLRHHANY